MINLSFLLCTSLMKLQDKIFPSSSGNVPLKCNFTETLDKHSSHHLIRYFSSLPIGSVPQQIEYLIEINESQ